jgi:hypothetical protein
MASLRKWFIGLEVLVCAMGLSAQAGHSLRGVTAQSQPAAAEQLFALANEARARAGAGKLQWDANLAEAAMKHCLRMAAEGPISHRYSGEPDLTTRAADAGAHFGLIEENIAVGPYPATIQQGWMESQGHRENMLSRSVDRVGIAVVASRGELFAVADFSHGVPVLEATQVEKSVSELIRVSGVSIRKDSRFARLACVTERGIPGGGGNDQPQYVMRWEDSDLSHLPQDLANRLASGRYRQAAVGSCQARKTQGSFTAYRVAVLLY